MPAHAADVVAVLAAERGSGISGAAPPSATYTSSPAYRCPPPKPASPPPWPAPPPMPANCWPSSSPPPPISANPGLASPTNWPGCATALLLVGFAGALCRAELAAIRVKHPKANERGLRLTLPRSKGHRTGSGVTVAIPYGATELCPIRALRPLAGGGKDHHGRGVPAHPCSIDAAPGGRRPLPRGWHRGDRCRKQWQGRADDLLLVRQGKLLLQPQRPT